MKKQQFVMRKIYKKKENKYYKNKKYIKFKGKVGLLPDDWIGKHCIVFPMTSYQMVNTKQKIRVMELINDLMEDPRKVLDKIELRKPEE